ncbi:MAG TPA: hypothetical protein VFI99_07650 [Nocardioides sp.]|nr:hypothetical protein [Nocardioides sp.]
MTINRTQGLVLAFFFVVYTSLLVILALSADVREVTARRIPGGGGLAIAGFLVALLGFLSVLTIAVLQRWHWAFWLILVAFAAGALRAPVAAMQLSGRMAPEGPQWYVVMQGVIGVVQVAIAVAMFAGYRRAGPWGSFRDPA